MTDPLNDVRSMAMVKLDGLQALNKPVTKPDIAEWVEKLSELLDLAGAEFAAGRDQLVRDLEAEYNVHVGQWNSLADDSDHTPWLAGRSNLIEWSFWNRYERFLRDHQGLPPASIRRLGEITDDILGRLEAPDRPGPWDRRGLVSGQVQSGKTGNYTGLIAKAIDAGYKLVVVLAGVHNSLRSQTQFRIDEGILGFDTRNHLRFDQSGNVRIGVGNIGKKFLPVNSFTSSKQTGDFSLSVARNIGVAVGGSDPIVLVVKKNASILNNLHKWATALRQETDPSTGKPIVRGVPVLVIDDEADNASVDTNGPKRGQDPDDVDPTKINGLIRKFLSTFEQTAYVAYTATPFANIFISPDAMHEDAGADLFPRSFIVNLPAPSTYVGPARVFGLEANDAVGVEAIEPLPIVRRITDYDTWLPDGHKSDATPGATLPESLREAILAFLIGVTIRKLRGHHGKHNSMLVHVTRFTKVQDDVARAIKAELADIQDRLALGEGSNPVLRERAAALYSADFVPTSAAIRGAPDVSELVGETPEFEEIWESLGKVAEATNVHVVNGTSADALEYVDHPDGLTVIAVGGDKLSRGLTLEGLSVSYYLRASKMYDTLMQMGRWFGYRPGYLDVCRLYTTPQLARWYSLITSASEELQIEFDAMAATGRTPADFGLRVRQHPDGLLVTSPTKLRHSRSVNVSYSGTIIETVTFAKRYAQRNWSSLEALVTDLPDGHGAAQGSDALKVWSNVPADLVLRFLSDYGADETAVKALPSLLADYIQARLADGELVNWTVALADAQSSDDEKNPRRSLVGTDIRLTHRGPLNESVTASRYSIRRVVSPRHELVDISDDTPEWAQALADTVKAWNASTRKKKSQNPPEVPGGLFVRRMRTPERGLLLLYPLNPAPAVTELSGEELDGKTPLVGFAISFPASDLARPVTYQVNKIFWDQEYGAPEEDDE